MFADRYDGLAFQARRAACSTHFRVLRLKLPNKSGVFYQCKNFGIGTAADDFADCGKLACGGIEFSDAGLYPTAIDQGTSCYVASRFAHGV